MFYDQGNVKANVTISGVDDRAKVNSEKLGFGLNS